MLTVDFNLYKAVLLDNLRFDKSGVYVWLTVQSLANRYHMKSFIERNETWGMSSSASARSLAKFSYTCNTNFEQPQGCLFRSNSVNFTQERTELSDF